MPRLPPPARHPPWLSPRLKGEGEAKPRRDPVAVLAASTFSSGMLLLPPQLQGDARSLYKALRTIDDLVDEHDPAAAERVEALERWATGNPASSPEAHAFERLCESYPISRSAVQAFCGGMRLDLEGTEIETDADLERYCLLAGGTVGVMLCGLLGTRHPDAEQKMEILGAAMQSTNILRDIDEDLANGRVYIPRSAVEHFGFPYPGQREQFLRDQIPRVDALYVEGMTAVALLEQGQRAIGVSGTLYRETLRQIERDGYGRKPGRASIPVGRKQKLIATYRIPTTPHAGRSTPAARQ